MPKITIEEEQRIGSIRLFELYRDYTKHQYDLINQRTTWYVQLQALLFASFGFSIQKKTEVIANKLTAFSECDHLNLLCENIGYLDMVLVLFCLVGVSASIIFFRVIKAASEPIKDLFDLWKHAKGNLELDYERAPADPKPSSFSYIPLLTGGTTEKHAEAGRKTTLRLPWVLGVIWGLTLIGVQIVPILRGESFLSYAIPALPLPQIEAWLLHVGCPN